MTSSNPNSPTNSPLTFQPFARGNGRRFRFMPANDDGNQVPPTEAPVAPVGFDLANLGTSVVLLWSDGGSGSNRATSYTYEWKTSAASTYSTGTISNTSVEITGLSEDTLHDFRVRAVNDIGQSGYASLTSVRTKLAPPTNVSISRNGTTINLSWTDNSSAEQNYFVSRSINGSTPELIGQLNAGTTSYANSGMEPGYFDYYVKAIKNYLTSGENDSPIIQVSLEYPNADGTPIAPRNLTFAGGGPIDLAYASYGAVGPDYIDVVWTPPLGSAAVSSYTLEVGENNIFDFGTPVWGAGPIITGITTTSTRVTFSEPIPPNGNGPENTPRFFRVRAVNANGNGSWSAWNTASTQIYSPTNISASVSGTNVVVSWTDNSYAAAYYLIYRSVNGGAFSYLDDVEMTDAVTTGTVTFTDTTTTGGNSYRYRVLATDGNFSNYSLYLTQPSAITVPSGSANAVPSVPTGLTATAASTTQINLTWNIDATASPNQATFYEIDSSTDNVLFSLLTSVNNPGTGSYSATGLTPATQYWFRMSSCNTVGCSARTASATATTTLAAPSGLTATATSSTQINLSWTDNSGNEDGFKVERSTDNSTWTEIAANVAANSTTYSATGLTASTLYYFRVRAYRGAVNSSYTSNASATTQSGSLSPSWSLDFSTGTTYSDLVLTRASTGTYVDSSGYIASGAIDFARLTHERASPYNRLGLLIEESRTNTFQRSQEFDNAYWTKTGLLAFGSGSTANAATAPDNTTTADLITEDSGGTVGHYVGRLQTFNANTSYTMSVFVKKPSSNGRDFATLVFSGSGGHRLVRTFDLADGTSTRNSFAGANFSTERSGSEEYRDGWWRLWISVTIGGTSVTSTTSAVATATSETPSLSGGGYPNHAGDGVSGLLLWGAQLGTNATPSSYISTTNASVTRSADLVHVLDSSITSWGDPGALVVHFYPPGQAGTLISTDDASTAQVGIKANSTTTACAFWSSSETSTGTIGTGVQKAVHYWNGSTSKFAINGGAVQSGTNNLTIANTDFVTLGAEATESGGVPGTFSQYANCVIRKVEFYSGTLTDANLQTITT